MSDAIAGLRSIQLAVEDGDAALSRPTVAYLLGAINATDSAEDKSQLLGLLALEYRKFELHDKELQAIGEAIELRPDNPMLHIAWSSSCLLRDKYEEAREAARIAVSKAEISGRFRRHALQTLARSLAALQQYGELETVVERLIQMKEMKPDSAIEADFLVGLPPESIREELRNQYLSLEDSKGRPRR